MSCSGTSRRTQRPRARVSVWNWRRVGRDVAPHGTSADRAKREPVNGRVHLSGAVLAAAGLVVLGAAAVGRGSLHHLIALGVFGVSALLMYAASALYHLSPRSAR